MIIAIASNLDNYLSYDDCLVQGRLSVGTCELEIFVRIESRIESAATIRIESGIESGYSRLRVIIITGEQRCADYPGSSNNIARSLLQC